MNKISKILISLALFIIIGGMYLYSSDFNFSTKKAYGSLLFSSNETTETLPSGTDSLSFISSLASLNRIKIDTSFFSSKTFTNLKDNRVVIPSATPGRLNPFAPINTN